MHKKKSLMNENKIGILLAFAPILGFLIFGLVPMVTAIGISFMNIKGYSFDIATFAGIDNYKSILTDPKFYLSIKNTLIAAIGMPISVALSLLVANLLHKRLKGTKIFRTIFFLPFVFSVVAISTMWQWMFNADFGIINQSLSAIGMEKIPWINDSRYFLISMIIMGVWGGMGFGIILYTGALDNVPKTYYEAAQIDGATNAQQFFRITLPCISPTTFFLITIGLIGAMQDFVRFQIMGGDIGGPGESGLTVVFYLWRMGFKNVLTQGMGMASATSILLAGIIIIITIINFKLSKLWVNYE